MLGVEVSLRAVFEAPTVAGLAARLAEARSRPSAALAVRERPERVPLSFAQQRLWFLGQLEGPSSAYNSSVVLRLSGDLDRQALGAALRDVLGRHEVLRTVFPVIDGEPYQQIIDLEDLSWEMAVADPAPADLTAAIAAAAGYAFDLSAEVPVRAWLFGAGPGEHVLVLAVHHIASDGWSLAPLGRDIAVAYAARQAGSGAGAGRRCRCSTPTTRCGSGSCSATSDDPDSLLSRQVAYWREALAGVPEELELPTDRPRPAVASYQGVAVRLEVPADLHRRLARGGAGAGRDAVHGAAGRAGGAAVAAGRGHRHPDRRRRSPGAVTRRWMTWSGSSSTPWWCAPTCPGTRPSGEVLAGCGRRAWPGWRIRTCRSSGWWRSWRRSGRCRGIRCSR